MLQELYEAYRGRFAFYVVYIQEAHPSDGWQVERNILDGIEVPQPHRFQERLELARTCRERLGLTVPLLLDTMDNQANRAFGGWPERLYAVGADGTVIYQGGKGPYGFNPEELRAFLEARVRANGP